MAAAVPDRSSNSGLDGRTRGLWKARDAQALVGMLWQIGLYLRAVKQIRILNF